MPSDNSGSKSSRDAGVLKRCQTLMQLMANALGCMNTYPSNSPTIEEHKERLYEQFCSFLSANSILRVTVSQSSLLIGEQVIYEEPSRSKSLAFLLYKDGLREMSFYEGITRQELDDFLDALAENWLAPEETDVVSLLWEKDFNSLTYLAVDEILSGTTERTDEASDQQGMATPISAGGGKTPPSSEIVTLKGEDRKHLTHSLRTAEDTEQTDAGMKTYEPILLNEKELQQIRDIVSEDKRLFNPGRELAEALFEILSLEKDADQRTSVLRIIREHLDALISVADFKTACQVVTALSEIGNSASSPRSEYTTFAERLLEGARSPEAIGQIRKLLRTRTTGSPEYFFEYLSSLGPKAAPVLIDVLEKAEHSELHSHARALIREFARTVPNSLEDWLHDPRAHIVKQLAAALGQPGLERAVPYLELCVTHQDRDVRKEVLKALSRIGDIPANEVIERFFNDSDPSLRVLAARTMTDPEPKSIQFVCSLTSQKAFGRKSTTEKKAWIDFLRKTGSDSVVPALSNLLNRRSWFRRRQNNEIRIYVVSALGSLATECALETLRKGARTGNRDVRNACRLALNKPRRKGQDPQFLHAHDAPEEE